MRASAGSAAVPSAHCQQLNIRGAGNGAHNAGKFHQYSIAGKFDDAAVMLADFRVNQIFPQHLQRSDSTGFVYTR